MSPRYALASAYGELMERLSTGMLMPCCPFDAADAVAMTPQAFAEQCPRRVFASLRLQSKDELAAFMRDCFGEEMLKCAPFRCLNDGSSALLPIELVQMLCGTTGLCAGNTPEEAMLQGLMEVFERLCRKEAVPVRVDAAGNTGGRVSGTQVLAVACGERAQVFATRPFAGQGLSGAGAGALAARRRKGAASGLGGPRGRLRWSAA